MRRGELLERLSRRMCCLLGFVEVVAADLLQATWDMPGCFKILRPVV